LFFFVLLSHIDLRSSISAKAIVYLEDFYLVTYITLHLVSVNSILFSWGALSGIQQNFADPAPWFYYPSFCAGPWYQDSCSVGVVIN
jgi:hypothetical protein